MFILKPDTRSQTFFFFWGATALSIQRLSLMLVDLIQGDSGEIERI